MKTGTKWWWILVVPAVILFVTADSAHARKMKGCWRIKGVAVGTAKVEDIKETFKDRFSDRICFYPGYRFEGDFQDASGLSGRWKQKGNKFTAYYDKEQIALYIEDEVERLVPAGVYLDMVITKAYVKGTRSGKKIKNGKVYVKGNGIITYRGQELRLFVKETGKFTGKYLKSSPSTAYESSSIEIVELPEGDLSPEALEGIINYIVDQINEVVNYPE